MTAEINGPVARLPMPPPAVVDQFSQRARALGVMVEAVAGQDELGYLIARLIRDAAAPGGPLVLAPGLAALYPDVPAWLAARGLTATPVQPADPAATFRDTQAGLGVSVATLGVAETGSLVMADTLADRQVRMLSHTHLVVLPRGRIIASLDETGDWLRALVTGTRSLPGVPSPARALSIVTGPSRTADIEMSLTVGAHGPAHLIVAMMETPTDEGAAA